MAEPFQFPKAYNQLLEEAPLGRFDFQSMPVIHPEAHTAYEDATLNRLHLLATAEHEQIHDMLARQTTHGYMILLAIRYFKKLPEAEKDAQLYRQIIQLHEEGRKMHEAYAVFGTLCVNRAFQPLLEALTPEYQSYLAEAEAMIPAAIRQKRMGRLSLYAAVLATLSPALPVPQGGDKRQVLQAAFRQISGCEERWAAIRHWQEAHQPAILAWMEQCAKEIGYTEKERQAPIYFEDINALLPGEQEYLAFEDKERQFTEQLVQYIGQEALAPEAQPITVSELKPLIRAYGQLLAPQYRLDPMLAETFGWDEATYGLLDRLFQENIHSTYLPGPVTTIHRLATDVAAVNRLAKHCAEQQFPLRIIGYLTGQLADSTFQKFQQHLPLASRLHIQWNFLYNGLSAYRQGEKLEILFSFEQRDFSQLEPEAAAHLSLFASPADYYHKPALRGIAEALAAKGVKLYLMQPLNFLAFLEWRQERGLPVQPFTVELAALPDNGLYLMKAWFEDAAHTYVRLVAQSTYAAVLKLYSLEQPRFSLNLREQASEQDGGIVNFLKVYWK
ncbi:MAG: hypothetical protein H6573_32375 [Lewinellaceae bacterium]|nr:hypothetical protein [Phaeodactylibacter sp.]MCB9352156.1 hypothetical protein [Lewinellaceae bacterium]